MQLRHDFRIAAALDSVAAALCSKAFNLEENLSRHEVISATYSLLELDDRHCVFRVDCREHGRGISGALDRNKRSSSTATSRWDAASRRLNWEWRTSVTDRIVLRGTYDLEQDGDGTLVHLVHGFQVDIPILGGSIARLIAKDSARTFPTIEELLTRHAAKNPGWPPRDCGP